AWFVADSALEERGFEPLVPLTTKTPIERRIRRFGLPTTCRKSAGPEGTGGFESSFFRQRSGLISESANAGRRAQLPRGARKYPSDSRAGLLGCPSMTA